MSDNLAADGGPGIAGGKREDIQSSFHRGALATRTHKVDVALRLMFKCIILQLPSTAFLCSGHGKAQRGSRAQVPCHQYSHWRQPDVES